VTYSVTNSAWNTTSKMAEVVVWDFIKIDSWTSHSVALSSHGKFYTWWLNSSYNLWLGNTTNRLSPVLHPLSNTAYLVDVAACDSSWHAVDSLGNLYSWGYGWNYALWNNSTTTQQNPVLIAPPMKNWVRDNYTKVSCSRSTGIALTQSGDVYAWWWSAYWGNGAGLTTDLQVPTKLSNLSNIVYINNGMYNGWAIDSNGVLYTWGTNVGWELGVGAAWDVSALGVTTYYNLPNNWNSITGAKAICFGTSHTILVKSDGTAYSWWSNSDGRLGNNTIWTSSYIPYQLSSGVAVWCKVNQYNSNIFTVDGLW
jgi:alpha-tubulin suppressor-like RCC1 family protein